MTDYTLLRTDGQVERYLNTLKEKNIRIIGIDTEGEFNLHRYGEHLCLIQIYDSDDFVLIDPQNLKTDTIQAFFENPKILKIMFDCSGDRTLIFRKYGVSINTVLDLQPAVELLEFEKRDLSSVTKKVLNIQGKPKGKYQRYNWTRRPIDPGALEYAIDDVRYLFELKDSLLESIHKSGKMDEYIRRNIEVQTKTIVAQPLPGVFRKGRFRSLSSGAKKKFRAIYDIRDVYARRLDLPPNSVVSNDIVFNLATGSVSAEDIRFNGKVAGSAAGEIRSALIDIGE